MPDSILPSDTLTPSPLSLTQAAAPVSLGLILPSV